MNKKGFTLLEILLVIAAIGILAAIVIVAINPTRQLAQVRNSTRQSDVNNLSKALDQYLIDQGGYPTSITGEYVEICAQDAPDCTGFLDLQTALVPTYIAAIPSDPQATGNGSGYRVAVNSNNDAVSVDALNAELDQTVAINSIPSSLVSGALWGWGDNSSGQLGTGGTATEDAPAQIGSDTDWALVSSGSNHALAVRADGTLWAWGSNGNGRLGDGTTTQRDAPVQIGSDTDWESVSAGDRHSMAIKTNGTLWSWGRNFTGELGQGVGSPDPILTPTQVGTDTDWESVSAGNGETLAIKDNGTLWGWGSNGDGGVGDGSGVVREEPVQVGSDTDWSTVSSLGGHALGLKDNGTLWGWGRNNFGQVGNDDTGIDALSPVQLGSDTDWASLIEGIALHSGAVKSNGTLWMWGYNPFEQLGFGGTFVEPAVPTQTGSDTDWESIAAGFQSSFGIKTDGTAWSWGDDGSQEQGNGAPDTDHLSPTQVGTDTDWRAVSAGNFHVNILK